MFSATPQTTSATSAISSTNVLNNVDNVDNTNNLMIYYDGNKISIDDLKQENYLIKNENNSLKIRCKALQETI